MNHISYNNIIRIQRFAISNDLFAIGDFEMRVSFMSLIAVAMLALCSRWVAAETTDRATKEECVAFVRKAVEYFNANGSAKAFKAFNDPVSEFHYKDLYIIADSADMTTLANGLIPKMTGRNHMDDQDSDGKFFFKERAVKMTAQKSFWDDYKYSDPITHKIAQKLTYCEVVTDPVLKDLVICSGIYNSK